MKLKPITDSGQIDIHKFQLHGVAKEKRKHYMRSSESFSKELHVAGNNFCMTIHKEFCEKTEKTAGRCMYKTLSQEKTCLLGL